jgi:hypothetical protein
MPSKSIKEIIDVIQEFEDEIKELSENKRILENIIKDLDKFNKKFPRFILSCRNYDYNDPEDFHCCPIVFYLHKSAENENIKLLNKIFRENKNNNKYHYIDLRYGEYGHIITKEKGITSGMAYEIPHVYTDMYDNLIKCLNIFYDMKTKKSKQCQPR